MLNYTVFLVHRIKKKLSIAKDSIKKISKNKRVIAKDALEALRPGMFKYLK